MILKSNAFEQKVEKTVKKFNMFGEKACPRVLVAVSGGADSVALLHTLSEVFAVKSAVPKGFVSCAHVNHMIRGEEADRDEEFVRNLCEKLGIKFYIKRVNIPLLAKQQKKGVEETARNERYAFFEELLQRENFDFVATAHTASDNAETMLFNLSRGAGIDGLCGIPPKRDNIIRPLILCTRDEVETYLAGKGADFVTDSTNLSTDYSRNLIRMTVVPQLKKINPSLEATLCKTAEFLRGDAKLLGDTAEKLLSDENMLKVGKKGEILVSAEALGENDAENSRIIKIAYERRFLKTPAGTVLAEIIKVLKNFRENDGKDGKKQKLVSVGSNGEVARITNTGITFLKIEEKTENNDFNYFLKSGENIICKTDYLVLAGEQYKEGFHKNFVSQMQNSYKLLQNYSILSDKILGNVVVRNRRKGDSYSYGGMTRKLKKVFCDMKIPEEKRKQIPIISDDNGIIFTAVTPISDAHKCAPGQKGDFPIAIYERIE